MARRKKVIVKCPNCGREKDYWVADSGEELQWPLSCRYCGEDFDQYGEIVLAS